MGLGNCPDPFSPNQAENCRGLAINRLSAGLLRPPWLMTMPGNAGRAVAPPLGRLPAQAGDPVPAAGVEVWFPPKNSRFDRFRITLGVSDSFRSFALAGSRRTGFYRVAGLKSPLINGVTHNLIVVGRGV